MLLQKQFGPIVQNFVVKRNKQRLKRLTALQFQRFYCKFPQNGNQNNTQGETFINLRTLKCKVN
jgi:hypothetical protein